MTIAPDPPASAAAIEPAEWGMPTRWAGIVFRAKSVVHQIRRGIRDFASGPQTLAKSDPGRFATILGSSLTPLWSDARPEERRG